MNPTLITINSNELYNALQTFKKSNLFNPWTKANFREVLNKYLPPYYIGLDFDTDIMNADITIFELASEYTAVELQITVLKEEV